MFELQEYREGDISPKLRYFFEYLDITFDKVDFESLNENDFLESLKYYIVHASPARQTANDYVRDVRTFFEMLLSEYGIRNSVFYDIEIRSMFEKNEEFCNWRTSRTRKQGMY